MIKTFIKRIWLSIVLCVLLCMGGGLSYGSLEWNLEVKRKKSVISIVTMAKEPTTVAGMEKVTKKLEKALTQVKGVDFFSSSTDSNKSTIEIHLKPETNAINALKEVGNITVTVKRPDYVKPPVIQQSANSDTPLINANIYSKNTSLLEVTRYAKEVIVGKLKKIDGVSHVEVRGEPKKEIKINLKKEKLSAYGIGIDQIRQAFRVYNKEKGFISRNNFADEFPVIGDSSIKNLQDIKNVILDFRRMIKLEDVADVYFDSKDLMSENWVNGKTKVITLKVFKNNDSNPLKTSDEVMKILNDWIKKYDLVTEIDDNSENIRKFFNKTKKTFVEAVLIVLAVVILFLGSLKSSITPILAIPISIIATLLPMAITGCSINISTLMAFLLAIGLVVDDAILVVENITQHYVQGKSLRQAAIDGTEEIKIPIIVMTMTLACVFFPAIASKGSFGATLKEFAITLSVSVIISGFVSLSLTPAICARVLSHSHLADKLMRPIEIMYTFLLRQALKLKFLFSILAVFTIVGSGLILSHLPKESMPTSELREIDIYTVGGGNRNLDFFKKNAAIAADYLKSHKEVKSFFVGMNKNIYLSIVLHENSKTPVRKISKEIMDFLHDNIKDLNFVQKSSKSSTGFDIFIFGNLTREEMKRAGYEFSRDLRYSPKIQNAISYSVSKIGYNLVIDYQKAAAIGCDINILERVVEVFNTRYFVSTLENDGKRFNIVASNSKNQDLDQALHSIWRENHHSKNIEISPAVFSTLIKRNQTNSLSNFNGLPAFRIEISGNHGIKIGDLIQEIQNIHRKSVGHISELFFTGKAKEFLEDQGEMKKIFSLSAIFIFLILLAQFESLKYAIIVMMTAPLAIFGSLVVIKSKGSINIYSTIAIITLIGLITKHGILFVNSTVKNLNTGLPRYEAVFKAATERLRPVLMTTLAMVLGLVPLLFDHSASMLVLNQMVVVLVPGLIFGTVMTLFVIPCLLLL